MSETDLLHYDGEHEQGAEMTKLLLAIAEAFLLTLFVLPTVSAQELVPGTLAHCDSVRGHWDAEKTHGWFGVCWTDSPESSCSPTEGYRLYWEKESRRCVVVRDRKAAAAQCRASGGVWGQGEQLYDECIVPSEIAKCGVDGGTWFQGNPYSASRCLRKSRDGGKVCTSSTQCELKCLAFDPKAESGSEAVGSCQSRETIFCGGTFVENGRVAKVNCIN